MKLNYPANPFIFLFLLTGAMMGKTNAQEAAVSPTILSLHYFLPENQVPYIDINTKKKVGRKFEPVMRIAVKVYFNEISSKNILGNVVTGTKGEGRVALPSSFKIPWDSANEFKFIAVSDAAAGAESLTSDITIKKAILVIDTISTDGTKKVTAQLKEKKGNEWVAVKEIEMKLRIKRMLGDLSVGEAESFTSDSTGLASADFKRDSIPGDKKGNIILVAKVEDNDSYGSLVVEKMVPCGKAVQENTHFWHRSLWATGNRAPLWLLFIALSIITGVWGTVIYIITQLFKIKRKYLFLINNYKNKLAISNWINININIFYKFSVFGI